MKKSIIALAVAGALTAPMIAQADATLFGGVRFEVQKTDNVDLYSNNTKASIGVKGSSTMDSGLTAGYYIEVKSGSDRTNGGTMAIDKSYAYVSGDFGKVTFGKVDVPYTDAYDRAKFLTMNDGALSLNEDDVTNGGITYKTNDMNGLTFTAGIANVDTDNATSPGGNAYGVAVAYDTDTFGVTLGAGKEAGTGSTRDSVVSLGGVAKLGAITLGAAFTKADTTKRFTLGGKYVVDKLTLAAEFVSKKTSGSSSLTSAALGAKFDLGGNAYVAAEYIAYNSNAEAASNADNLRIRYNVSF